MKAMVFESVGSPLVLKDLPAPIAKENQVLIKVSRCGICRTDLHIVCGELSKPKLPLVLGHQIVGTVEGVGKGCAWAKKGFRVGVGWLGETCGHCSYCDSGKENLCDEPKFTGYDLNGGFAEFAVANESSCFRVPDNFDDLHAAPLLCAGLIGYRSYRMTGSAKRLGFYGFGVAAHILIQLAMAEGKEVLAFTRPGDKKTQTFARSLGAKWAGGSDEKPPQGLDAAIIFASVGELVPKALKSVKKGGVVVCAGIHMSDIPSFPYQMLWGERSLRSVANLTRLDGQEFLQKVSKIKLRLSATEFTLENANEAIDALNSGLLTGAAVLKVSDR